MASSRARKLQQLSMSLPGANQQIAQGQQAARQIQLQEQIKQIQPGTGGPGLAQKMGAQQAAQEGQIALGATQRGQAQQQLLGQEALAEKGREVREQAFQDQISLSRAQRTAADSLAKLDRTLKTRLIDDQLQFKKDKAGRTLLNDRQLMDWAVANAQSKEEMMEYAQAANQVYEKDIQMLEIANAKMEQVLQQGYVSKGKKLDRETELKIRQAKNQLLKDIERKKAEKANKMAMLQAGLQVVGAIGGGVAGFMAGGPTMAAAGAQTGSQVLPAAGTAIKGATG